MLQPKMPKAAKLSNLNKGPVPVPTLPSITVNKMTQGQLRKFIPHLLKHVIGGSKTGYGSIMKPMWWPVDIPWHHLKVDHKTNTLKEMTNVDNLKRIVRNCYHYFGQERLLNDSSTSPESASSPLTAIDKYYQDVVNDVIKQKTNNYTSVDRWGEVPSCNLRSSPRMRRVNQSLLPDLGPTQPTSPQDKALTSEDAKPFLEIYICFFCEKEFENRRDMCRHQAKCKEQPPRLQVVLSLPRHPLHIQPPKISPVSEPPSSVTRPPKRKYMDSLNLLPGQKAKEIKAKVRESSDVDCEIIDVIEPPKTPVALTPPRTPKLLISQLSRDESWTRRKSLTFGHPPSDLSDDESVNSVVSENEPDRLLSACPRNASLLSIPFTSLLGQRIRRHVKSEGQSVLSNAESFCKTPVKNNALQRLRERQSNYPVTFKKTKRFSTKYCHEYKFNKKQNNEFMECLKIGLSRRSLRLLKKTKPCVVKLQRMTKQQLVSWQKLNQKDKAPQVHSRQLPHAPQGYMHVVVDQTKRPLNVLGPTTFPQQPALLSEDMDRILGLKKKACQESNQQSSLPLGSMVSEQLNAEASQQKLTVYRSLLSEYSSAHSATNQQASLPPKLPCLNSLLLIPNGQSHLPKKTTQLAQMLNAPLSQLPAQPPSLVNSHVENWLTNNNFYAKDKDSGLGDLNKNCVNRKFLSAGVQNNPLAQRSKRNYDRQYARCIKKLKLDQNYDNRTSLDTSDNISVHSISSSEDEYNPINNNIDTAHDGLPIIMNTFSLAPGHFQPSSLDRDHRLILPPQIPKLRLPAMVKPKAPVPCSQSCISFTQPNSSTSMVSLLQKSTLKGPGAVFSNLLSGEVSATKSSPAKSDISAISGSSAPIRRSRRLQVMHPEKHQPVANAEPMDKIKPIEIICID